MEGERKEGRLSLASGNLQPQGYRAVPTSPFAFSPSSLSPFVRLPSLFRRTQKLEKRARIFLRIPPHSSSCSRKRDLVFLSPCVPRCPTNTQLFGKAFSSLVQLVDFGAIFFGFGVFFFFSSLAGREMLLEKQAANAAFCIPYCQCYDCWCNSRLN